MVSVGEVRTASSKSIEAATGDKKISTVLASDAVLVAAICAEDAETVGANRFPRQSVVKTGLESQSSDELLTLTATAATCLRGAATLKLRADVRGTNSKSSMSSNTSIQKGATLRVCLPCARHGCAEIGEEASARHLHRLRRHVYSFKRLIQDRAERSERTGDRGSSSTYEQAVAVVTFIW